MNNDFEKFVERIRKKLNDNPELKKEIEENINRLSEIFEAEVNINLEFYPNVENYKEIFKKYEDGDFIKINSVDDSDLYSLMKLKDLKAILNDESEDNLYLCIDPIYLEKGINDINDMLITTIDDRIILIPTKKK